MSRKPRQLDGFEVSFSDASAAGFFRCFCENVVDGDTIDVFADLGFYQFVYCPIRLNGVDTEETRGTSGAARDRAVAAFELTQERALERQVLVRTFKDRRSFNRFIGDVFVPPHSSASPLEGELIVAGTAWTSLAKLLIDSGLGDPMKALERS